MFTGLSTKMIPITLGRYRKMDRQDEYTEADEIPNEARDFSD